MPAFAPVDRPEECFPDGVDVGVLGDVVEGDVVDKLSGSSHSPSKLAAPELGISCSFEPQSTYWPKETLFRVW